MPESEWPEKLKWAERVCARPGCRTRFLWPVKMGAELCPLCKALDDVCRVGGGTSQEQVPNHNEERR